MKMFFLGSWVIAILFNSASLSAQQQLVGDAVDIKSGKILYKEVHTFTGNKNSQKMKTAYVAPDDSELAVRTVSYVDDMVSSYTLKLNNIDYQESVSRTKDGLEFNVTAPGKSKKTKKVALSNSSEAIIDAGFNNFLQRNWDQLLAGETIKFDFASTDQLDTVKLQVRVDERRSTQDRVIFSMSAANFLYRMLLNPIKAGFYRESRQLAYYKGVSNLQDDSENAYEVEITFADGQLSNSSGFASN